MTRSSFNRETFTISRRGQRLALTLGLLMVSVPALSEALSSNEPSDEQSPPRIRSTFKAVSPGTPLSNDEAQRQMRVEPMQPRPRATREQSSETKNSQVMNAESASQACRDLQNEIASKIRANQVSDFTLEAVPAARAQEVVESGGDQYSKVEIVGSCGQGAYKVVYRRG